MLACLNFKALLNKKQLQSLIFQENILKNNLRQKEYWSNPGLGCH